MTSTHGLSVGAEVVVKRYSSWDRGEHRREWAVLRTVHEYAPGLCPRPVEAHLDATPPVITMSRLPGVPLTEALAAAHPAEIATAVRTLWRIPHAGLGEWSDDLAFARRLTSAPRPPGGMAADAWEAAAAWWDGPDPVLLATPPPATVLGHRDPNITNYLWDGRHIRIVDLEDAAVSDPATELAILLEHMAWRHIDAQPLLRLIEVDPERLPAARRQWAMFWLWLMRPGSASAARNPAGARDRQARSLLSVLTSRGPHRIG
jgi:hypothetical protein